MTTAVKPVIFQRIVMFVAFGFLLTLPACMDPPAGGPIPTERECVDDPDAPGPLFYGGTEKTVYYIPWFNFQSEGNDLWSLDLETLTVRPVLLGVQTGHYAFGGAPFFKGNDEYAVWIDPEYRRFMLYDLNTEEVSTIYETPAEFELDYQFDLFDDLLVAVAYRVDDDENESQVLIVVVDVRDGSIVYQTEVNDYRTSAAPGVVHGHLVQIVNLPYSTHLNLVGLATGQVKRLASLPFGYRIQIDGGSVYWQEKRYPRAIRAYNIANAKERVVFSPPQRNLLDMFYNNYMFDGVADGHVLLERRWRFPWDSQFEVRWYTHEVHAPDGTRTVYLPGESIPKNFSDDRYGRYLVEYDYCVQKLTVFNLDDASTTLIEPFPTN